MALAKKPVEPVKGKAPATPTKVAPKATITKQAPAPKTPVKPAAPLKTPASKAAVTVKPAAKTPPAKKAVSPAPKAPAKTTSAPKTVGKAAAATPVKTPVKTIKAANPSAKAPVVKLPKPNEVKDLNKRLLIASHTGKEDRKPGNGKYGDANTAISSDREVVTTTHKKNASPTASK